MSIHFFIQFLVDLEGVLKKCLDSALDFARDRM